jgi:hypothetical protein
MTEVFLDTSFAIALSSVTDRNHVRAVELANQPLERTVEKILVHCEDGLQPLNLAVNFFRCQRRKHFAINDLGFSNKIKFPRNIKIRSKQSF